MDHIIQLTLTPGEAFDANTFQELVNEVLHREGFPAYTLLKRSIDARRGVKVHVQLGLLKEGEVVSRWSPAFKKIKSQRPVIIVGAGPAGLFAAIRCLEKGLKPLVIERGKDVQARRRDIALINREGVVNTDSNYCFGEGGAGTYSDGKLYTRSKKRGDVRLVLEILRWYGAGEEILYDAHPHIGTNKLPA
ncbi:MAG: NAD(P)/FAD-dependent oxidoreductase, partial [Cyclobacteriaceae bacterium]|nr:NAD(P)/FAD-dependent oxidoreductase [Cyclobacteriaceae bacterium]